MKLGDVQPGTWFRLGDDFFIKIRPTWIGSGFFHSYSLSDGAPRFATKSNEPPDMHVTPIPKPEWLNR